MLLLFLLDCLPRPSDQTKHLLVPLPSFQPLPCCNDNLSTDWQEPSVSNFLVLWLSTVSIMLERSFGDSITSGAEFIALFGVSSVFIMIDLQSALLLSKSSIVCVVHLVLTMSAGISCLLLDTLRHSLHLNCSFLWHSIWIEISSSARNECVWKE